MKHILLSLTCVHAARAPISKNESGFLAAINWLLTPPVTMFS